tara:strand:+ start:1143 stop:3611 length:2469 start_codon:yes stop_codon:yes gene_type:complete
LVPLVVFGQNNVTTEENPFTIDIIKVHKNTIYNMDDILEDEKTYNLENHHHLSRFSSLDIDWNNDQLNDIFLNIAALPEIGSFSGLLLQERENGNIKFRYIPTHKVFFEGDAGNIAKSVEDFNGDGLIDVYYHTENYHGEDGNQPSSYDLDDGNYFCRLETFDKFYINNGQGFDLIEGFDFHDNSNCPKSHAGNIKVDIDNDSSYEIIGVTGAGDWQQCKKKLLSLYRISGNSVIEEKVLNTNLDCSPNWETYQYAAGINFYNEKIYYPVWYTKYKHTETGYVGYRNDEYWNANNFWADFPDDGSVLLQQEWKVLVYNDFYGDLVEEIILNDPDIFSINKSYGHEWFFYVEDYNNDGDVEFYVNRWIEESTNDIGSGADSTSGQDITIYNNLGEDITEVILGWSNYSDYFGISSPAVDPVSGKTFDLSVKFDKDITESNAQGIHLDDINNDGFVDIIPQGGWYINLNCSTCNSNYTNIIFMNDGEKFYPTEINFPQNHSNSSNTIFDGSQIAYNFPLDLDNDGNYEMMHILQGGSNQEDEDGAIDIFEFSFDNDGDGFINSNDAFPNNPYSNSADLNGDPIFSLAQNNFTVGVNGTSCIGSSDGKISILINDQNLNYIVTINGENSLNFDSNSGYDKIIEDLTVGSYDICFSVEGQDSYNQCFSLNLIEPQPLSVYSRVDSSNKSLSLNMNGSNKYTIKLNGKITVVDSNSLELKLKSGINLLEVYTDQTCQGVYTEEIFASEEVQYYPNPTSAELQVFVSGFDNEVNLSINGINGYCFYDKLMSVSASRKIDVDLSELNNGIYIIQIDGETVNKSFKIIKK